MPRAPLRVNMAAYLYPCALECRKRAWNQCPAERWDTPECGGTNTHTGDVKSYDYTESVCLLIVTQT